MAALENNQLKLGSDADEAKNLVIKSNVGVRGVCDLLITE